MVNGWISGFQDGQGNMPEWHERNLSAEQKALKSVNCWNEKEKCGIPENAANIRAA